MEQLFTYKEKIETIKSRGGRIHEEEIDDYVMTPDGEIAHRKFTILTWSLQDYDGNVYYGEEIIR